MLAACGAAVLPFSLTACSPIATSACAMAWVSDTVHVHVVGDTAAVADIGYCGGASSCVPQRQSVIHADSTPTPLPAHHEGDDWNLPTGHDEPRRGRVAAYDRHGTTLAEHGVRLTWKNEGTEQCPGPYSTRVALHVPNEW